MIPRQGQNVHRKGGVNSHVFISPVCVGPITDILVNKVYVTGYELTGKDVGFVEKCEGLST